jgi:hypothetical protein
LLLETVVIDVEGLTEDDDKTPVKYSRELGQQLLLDPDYRVFRAGAAYAARSSRTAVRPTRRSRQKTSRRPDLAAGLGRQDRRHRCCGNDCRHSPGEPAVRCKPGRAAVPSQFRSARVSRAFDRSPAGFERGTIPWRSIDAYAARYGLVDDDFDRFVRIIRAMDGVYLDYFRKPEG